MEAITLWLAKLFDGLKTRSPIIWAVVCAISAGVIWLQANGTISLPGWAAAIIALITGAGGSRTSKIIAEAKEEGK